MAPFFSIIVPVKNAGTMLGDLLKSLKELDYPKDSFEVIIADGLSKDNSVEIAQGYGAKVLSNPKQTVSPGRNIGFADARGEFIAFTDADCIITGDWLKNSLKYFDDPKVAGVGGPNFTPKEEKPFGKAVGFIFGQAIFAAGSIHARNLKCVKPVKSLPGCNAIYRRAVLDKVMPVDEKLLTCDDTEMNRQILDLGYKLLTVPDVAVWHYRRPNPKSFYRQMYRYAIGRLQLGKKKPYMLNPVHILTGLAIPLILGLSVLLFLLKPALLAVFWIIILAGLLLLFLFGLLNMGSIPAAANVPFAVSILICGWSIGFLRELFFPMKDVTGK